MKPLPSRFVRNIVLVLAILTAGCGQSSSPDTADGGNNAAINTPLPALTSTCDIASFPSAQWTQCELENYAVTSENITAHADLLPGMVTATTDYQSARLATLLADPERQPNPNPAMVASPIDPRVQGWEDAGGLVETVVYTSRSGATMSGHVWATRSGAAKRPGIVIINGSIIGFEEVYWFLSQALAKAGFVMMTFDAQGEGMSDQFGEAPDQLEDAFAATPGTGPLGPQGGLGGNGLPFYDGGTDALNFLLSTPSKPYVPVPSRTSGTSHAAKQARRVAAGLNNAYNPLWELLDPTRIGFTGHSYGAEAASWLTQNDPRVATGVALDVLCVPVWPSPDEVTAISTAAVNTIGGALPAPAFYGLPRECVGAPAGPAPKITKPALSITSDYLLAPIPYALPPRPDDKSLGALEYEKSGVDTGTIVIRGGTHYEFNDLPAALPATLRGIDMVRWYTTAWFSKYLLHDAKADAMLLTSRWRDDAASGTADPAGDANLYSWHYRSWLNFGLAGGGRFNCQDLRRGCIGQVDQSDDGERADYSFLTAGAVTPDANQRGAKGL